MPSIRVFNFIEELDAFVVSQEFADLADRLNLTEWNHVVWLGRLFMLDEDYGEHWFDNWDEREALQEKAKSLGIDDYDLMIVVPSRFAGGTDGPCHSDQIRKLFWMDVLKSLELSCEFVFQAARDANQLSYENHREDYLVF